VLKKAEKYRNRFVALKPYFSSFGFKLFIFIGAALTALIGIGTYYNISMQEKQLIDEVLIGADNIAGTVKYSTRNYMLENTKEKVQETIDYIAKQSDEIETIRIFDKRGVISKSTVSGEIGDAIDIDAEQCAVCHAGGAPLEDIEISDRARISKSKSGEGRVVSLTQAIYNEEGCYLMCHDHHPRDKKVLGLFDITMSLSDVDNKIAGIKRHLIILGVSSFIAIMTALAAMLYYFLIRPMTALLGGVRDVSAGNYNTRVPVYASDEFGRLSRSFNRMAEKLRKESGYRSFLTYDTVAPEIVNGDSISKRSPIAPGYVGRDPESGSTFEDIYSRINDETHMKLVRSVKLASLGQLSAGIAHEINNPLTAVLSYSSLLLERVEGEKEKKWLSVVVDETKRCRNIVAGLLEFSRQSTPEKSQTKINDVILRAISLVENQESFHNIKILKDLAPDLPELNVDRGQMHQVFMNLLINSADAMKGIGTVSVESRLSVVESKVAPPRSFVEVSLSDTGCGVPAENLERLFDPFFTTKGPTEGTGLGLSICFGIVKRHNGDITVKSVVGQGSTFCVKLPVEGVANA